MIKGGGNELDIIIPVCLSRAASVMKGENKGLLIRKNVLLLCEVYNNNMPTVL